MIRAWAAVLIGLAAATTAAARPAAAATPTGSVSLSPSSNLTLGEVVQVTGHLSEPNTQFGLFDCYYVLQNVIDGCDVGTEKDGTTDANGFISTTYVPQAGIHPGSAPPGFVVDCSQFCVVALVVFDSDDNPVIAGTAGYRFSTTPPSLLPGTASIAEGNTGSSALDIPVTLSKPPLFPVSARWQTVFVPGAVGNQADPATDYTPASGRISFAQGETAKTLRVTVNADTVVEPDEYIVVQFGDPSGATLGGYWGLGFGLITNDDHAVVVPGTAAMAEGNTGTTALDVPVTLSNASTVAVTAHWRTVFVAGAPGNQADPATDYTPAGGTITFAPGEIAKSVTVVVNGDLAPEPDEYIVVQFGNPTNAGMGGFWGLGFGTITNDDSS